MENDPNLYMTSSEAQTHVKFAYGDINSVGGRSACGSLDQRSLPVYDIYQLFLTEQQLDEETFFASVDRMIRADDIASTARWVCTTWSNTRFQCTDIPFILFW